MCFIADLIKQEGLIHDAYVVDPEFTASQLYAEVCTALSNYYTENITHHNIV